MLKKVVLVGLGGSGGKTVRTTHAAIERLLRSRGWREGVPQAWQFIHLDVPSAPDGLDPELPPAIPGTYYGMVPSGATYSMVDRGMTSGTDPALALRATSGWRPDAREVPVPISLGAGQYRALGRVVTVQSVDTLDRALQSAMSRVNEGPVEGQLSDVARLLGGDATNAMDSKTYVLVVSSMAGGSGAGMVVDVVDLALGQFGNKSVLGWLYAPDVFDDLPEIARQGVRPNALATLMEWTASCWNDEGPVKTAALLESRGVTIGSRDPENPPAMMLVGKTNGTVTFPNQNTIYTATGRMLAALMTSEKAMDDLVAYGITNRQNNSPKTHRLHFMDSKHQSPPFQAFGFARVGLGLDLFGDYSAEWLARSAAEVLLRRHLLERQGRSDNRTDQQLVEAVADRAFRNFVINCGLDERGPDNNQIIDALRSTPQRDARFNELLGAIGQAVSQRFVKPAATAEIVQQITTTAHAQRLAFSQDLGTYRLQAAQAWVEEIQTVVLTASTEALSRHGLPVAARLLQKLTDEEVPAILDDLRGEAAEYSRWGSDVEGVTYNALAAAPAALPATHPAVDAAVRDAATALWFEGEADLRLFAVELLEDFRQGYLVPLQISIRDARDALVADDAPADGRHSEVKRWASGDHVPLRFKPPLNEFLLIEPDTFAAQRRDLVVASVPDLEGDAAEMEAVSQIAQGRIEADSPVIAVRRPGQWVPVNDKVRPKQLASGRARFETRLRAKDLLDYAYSWTRYSERAMGRYLGQTLRDYLSDPDVAEAERIRRADRLRTQLMAGIKASKPLVSVNPKMVAAVHNETDLGVQRAFTEIPVKGLGEAEQKVQQALINALGSAEAQRIKLTDGAETDIEIFTASQPAESLAFESVIQPIMEEWLAVAGSGQEKRKFWQWRRARPLTEFVPMKPAYRRSFVRGWFTARIMGILDATGAKAVRVQDADGRWLSFPYPMLWDPAAEYDKLPAVLKSVAIAFLDARRKQDLTPFAPYFRLIQLGSGHSQYNPDELLFDQPNDEFAAWLAGDAERRAAAQHLLGELRTSYERVLQAVKDPHRSPRVFELEEDVMDALNDLSLAVEDLGGGGVF